MQPDDDYYEEIIQDVWLMDDHRWAYLIWESNREKFKGKKVPIIHIDYHWDAGDDFFYYPDKEKEFKDLSFKELKELVKEDKWIRYDSFICPAIIRGITDEVHFLCYQDEYEEGIYEKSLEKHHARQYIYRKAVNLNDIKLENPYILDFDVDIFNRSNMYYGSDIWKIKEIDAFLNDITSLVKEASIITVAMSYGCSGTKDDTERLTKHIMGKFCSWRKCGAISS